jgi:hypothetical protein
MGNRPWEFLFIDYFSLKNEGKQLLIEKVMKRGRSGASLYCPKAKKQKNQILRKHLNPEEPEKISTLKP